MLMEKQGERSGMIAGLLGSLRNPWSATALPSVISFIAPQLGGLTPTSSLQRPPEIRSQPLVNQRQFATLLVGNAERKRTTEREHPFDFAEQVGQVIVRVVARF
jgi:hypothetical protein